MLAQDAFELGRIDIEAASDDHVLEAVDNVDIPIAVHVGEITRVQKAFGIHGLGGGIRPVQVALHGQRALERQLSDFARW
ncbi:hypothetical protein D3C72_1737040 [compost metagenome]